MKIEEKIREILEAYRRAVVHITMAQGTDQDVQVAKNTIPKIQALLEEEKREIFREIEEWLKREVGVDLHRDDWQALKSRYLKGAGEL